MNLDSINAQLLVAAQQMGKTDGDMVYGEGSAKAAVMLIGEAPGAEETRLSRPFVGRAGKNLEVFLSALGLRRADIYITNVVKFRPYKLSARGTMSNRPPQKEEIACMRPFLMREIEAVSPRVVVTLGNVPLKSLAGSAAIIGSHHAVPAACSAFSHSFTLFPLYHPASVIYNRSLLNVYEQDIRKLKGFLGEMGLLGKNTVLL